jgi:hypothetical protein
LPTLITIASSYFVSNRERHRWTLGHIHTRYVRNVIRAWIELLERHHVPGRYDLFGPGWLHDAVLVAYPFARLIHVSLPAMLLAIPVGRVHLLMHSVRLHHRLRVGSSRVTCTHHSRLALGLEFLLRAILLRRFLHRDG